MVYDRRDQQVALEQRPGGHRPPLKEVDWEVLPPEEKRRQGLEPLFKWLSLIMDNFLRVPGTKFRFGLDPLLGIIPGIGDTSSALVSAFALIQAARVGVPKVLLARMSANILLNEIIGIVPIAGDAFSFWFKSNARNYQIIKDHIAAPRPSRRSDWIFVIGVLVALVGVVCLGIAASFFLVRQVIKLFGGA
ncbi:MAG: hypothetical protein QOH88_2543 [Verrucomicrobiota bacterium]